MPVNMIQLLSQITIKVPLQEMLRIEEHREKAMAWVKSASHLVEVENENISHNTKERKIRNEAKDKELEGLVSQIPQIYLEDIVGESPENVDPFFLSVIINGGVLKNCMIDSRASTNVMPVGIMESMGLNVDTLHGICCAMDSREVFVIGTIKALPYKLAAFPEKGLIMSVLAMDIPPHY